ncbi:hypothetical protein TNCV_5122051 [Trichonephila clavipes]|nr:hypothetical protein TNCV_5122051 [Trichonephila clavipes]
MVHQHFFECSALPPPCYISREVDWRWQSSCLPDLYRFDFFFYATLNRLQHGATQLRVKEDIENVSSELGNEGYRLHFFMKLLELYSGRVRI